MGKVDPQSHDEGDDCVEGVTVKSVGAPEPAVLLAKLKTSADLPKSTARLMLQTDVPALIGTQNGVAAARAGIASLTDYSSLLSGLGGVPSGVAAAMASLSSSRLSLLERGFRMESGIATDAFGELRKVVSAHPGLDGYLRIAVSNTQRSGAFGLDYRALQQDAFDVSLLLNEEPELERRVRSSLEPVQELTGLTDERMFEIGDFFGWWARIATHRVSTAGIIFGFTVGLTVYILEASPGLSAVPSAAATAMVAGGAIYEFIHRLESHSRDSE